mmetsp:Transcript_2982/g.6457  ORF Transcript_2982/g.6457 Transcript_2982/m.6457 type:complete len:266 (-) Transcript_2982:2620-3417(-)
MAATTGAYKPTKEEIYVAIDAALSDNTAGAASSALDAPAIQKAVTTENPNWQPINPRKFRKYQRRVIQARDAGIAPNAIVSSGGGGDDGSVSTIGSMTSRARSFITKSSSTKNRGGSAAGTAGHDDEDTLASTANSTIGSMRTSFKKKIGAIRKKNKKVAIPSSIGADGIVSPSPLKDAAFKKNGVEYSAVPAVISEEGEETGTAQTSADSSHSVEEAVRKLGETLNAEVADSDTKQESGEELYADDNDGKKGKDECCAQGCIIL